MEPKGNKISLLKQARGLTKGLGLALLVMKILEEDWRVPGAKDIQNHRAVCEVDLPYTTNP